MFWLNFERWTSMAGKLFIRDRCYWQGYKWTPLVWVRPRWTEAIREGRAQMHDAGTELWHRSQDLQPPARSGQGRNDASSRQGRQQIRKENPRGTLPK